MINILLLLLALSGNLRIDHVTAHRADHFNLTNERVAIDYYDPISFYKGTPRIGLKSISFTYNAVIYCFSNDENKDEFIKDFLKFEPRFGGWCAYSMTVGQKIDFDPKYSQVINDSLYLFKDNDSKIKFANEYEQLNKKAWSQWAKILPTFDPADSVFRFKRFKEDEEEK